MANGDTYGYFWNSDDGDRTYDAESFTDWLKKFFTTGVFIGDLQVTATSGMEISVDVGYVNINGKVKHFSTATAFTIATASATNPRIDNVAVECDTTNRTITLKVVQGSPSANPVPPAVVRNNGIYQLILARVRVEAGASSITQENITDTRGYSDVCGYVTGTVEEIDFEQIQAQFDAYIAAEQTEFETWFEAMKDQLSTDAAGHLQSEIDDIVDDVDDINDKIEKIIPFEPHPESCTQSYLAGSVVLIDNGNGYEVRFVLSNLEAGDSLNGASLTTRDFAQRFGYVATRALDAYSNANALVNNFNGSKVVGSGGDLKRYVRITPAASGSRVHIGTVLLMMSSNKVEFIRFNYSNNTHTFDFSHIVGAGITGVTWDSVNNYYEIDLGSNTLVTAIIGGGLANGTVTFAS